MIRRSEFEKIMADLRKAHRQGARGAAELPALADLLHPLLLHAPQGLQAQLVRLWNYSRRCDSPLAAVFAVRRYSSRPILRELWWLQVLVMVAQGFSSRRCWIVPSNLDPMVQTAKGAAQASRDAWGRHVRDRGSAALGDLIDAIELLLDYMPRGLTLDGRYLVKGGVRIDQKLKPKEALFMRLLIEADGRPVSRSDSQNHGIMGVDVIKTRFLRVPAFVFLEDHIVSAGGLDYQLNY